MISRRGEKLVHSGITHLNWGNGLILAGGGVGGWREDRKQRGK